MSRFRRAAKIDKNQTEIVKQLRKIPGVTVEVNHDDILIGRNGVTYWIEIKDEDAVSKKTGLVLDSAIKPSQKKLLAEWKGHYAICSSYEQVLKEIGL